MINRLVCLLLIFALVTVAAYLCADITLSGAVVARDASAVTVRYRTNIPCRMDIVYCSDRQCGSISGGYSWQHDIVLPRLEGVSCYDVKVTFTGVSGKTVTKEFCVDMRR